MFRVCRTQKCYGKTQFVLWNILAPGIIDITVFDQIPVSVVDNINVSAENISNGSLAEDTGIVKWELQIPSNEQTKLGLEYEVKYPKWEKVVLE